VKPVRNGNEADVRRYRTKLLIAMMLVVVALTGLGLFLAQRKVAIEATLDMRQDFQNELASLHSMQKVRHQALAERCRDLVVRPRIHAALEDNALDLLYPSAKDELRDLVEPTSAGQAPREAMHAKFYRFLDSEGAVISPPNPAEVGELRAEEEARLRLTPLPEEAQIGYLQRYVDGAGSDLVDEVIVLPVVSTETGDVISALVLGFKPIELGADSGSDIKSGVWLNGRLYSPALDYAEQLALGSEVAREIGAPRAENSSVEVSVGGAPHLLFYKQLNPGSVYPPAYEVAVYPLANAIARQRQIRWHAVTAGLALLFIGFIASHFLSRRLSAPVEELAVTSELNRAERVRAEAALEMTSEELQRAARFSADASHQLKTPVSVMRAGIEHLLRRNDLDTEAYDELSALLHQTYRISGVVDDLLLLSRMDAGRLQIQFEPVNLSQLLEEWIDDVSALPDDLHVKLDTNFPPNLYVAGEKRYIALIVQNLLENARKYNIPGGDICVAAEKQGEFVVLTVENTTARPIPPAARDHIFERFHRGGMGENVPGHGLGLNLARELARLHGGDLRLVRSDEKCAEFEVRFRAAPQPVSVPAAPDPSFRPAPAAQPA
jgi:signal transduction histidine kinase